jgi:hypothetical protein
MGIGIGAGAALVLITLSAFLIWSGKRKQEIQSAQERQNQHHNFMNQGEGFQKSELYADSSRPGYQFNELPSAHHN